MKEKYLFGQIMYLNVGLCTSTGITSIYNNSILDN